jgi:hypothetical protein
MDKVSLLALFLLLNGSRALAQRDWKLNTEKDGIKVYLATVPDSKIKAVKVMGEFKSTPAAMVAVLMDVEHGAEWVYHTKSCRLVKQGSPSELYYYSEISLPWPAENRDFVAHLSVSENAKTHAVTVDGPAVPGFVAQRGGIVRIAHSEGQWIITPRGNDQIDVQYTLQVDPGGSLPAWLVNTFAAEGPIQIFKKLKLQLQKPAYQNAHLPDLSTR